MNIRVDLNIPINDGKEVVFRSPVDCSQVTGLIVYYPANGNTISKEFAFADAHGNNVGDIDHLFAENVVVKVILDVTTGMAFVQNADTNAYLEGRFAETIEKCCVSFEESGAIVTCEPVEDYPLDVVTHIEPVQAGSGIPSPDNVRPITGWTGAKLWRGSKNLFNESAARVGSNWHYNTESSYYVFEIGGLKPNTAYTFSFTENSFATNPNPNLYLVVTNDPSSLGTSQGWFIHPAGGYLCNQSATIVSNGDGKLFIRTFGMEQNETILNEVFNTAKNGMLEHGESQTGYEPYRGEFFRVDFGQAVYGGSYDWKTGVLTTADGEVVQFAPQQILALSGRNTLYSDTGDTTVIGRADPTSVIEKLTNAIIALGGKI